jgi:hypothetical protein
MLNDGDLVLFRVCDDPDEAVGHVLDVLSDKTGGYSPPDLPPG